MSKASAEYVQREDEQSISMTADMILWSEFIVQNIECYDCSFNVPLAACRTWTILEHFEKDEHFEKNGLYLTSSR